MHSERNLYVIDSATLTPELDKLNRLTRAKLCISYAMGWAIAEDTRHARARGLQCLPAGAGEMHRNCKANAWVGG